MKTKNAPKALKRKINLNFFCGMGVPKLGEGEGGGLPTWDFFPLKGIVHNFFIFGQDSYFG